MKIAGTAIAFLLVVAGCDKVEEIEKDAQLRRIEALENELSTMRETVRRAEELLTLVRVEGREIIVEGANLNLRNGSGESYQANGFGNLVVGYGEGDRERTGSHVVAIGPAHSYTGVVGLVVGSSGSLRGDYASVIGGIGNRVYADYGVIAGGDSNEVHAEKAAICGGFLNRANGKLSTMLGGDTNTGDGVKSVVCGGWLNRANGELSTVLGGSGNTADGYRETVLETSSSID